MSMLKDKLTELETRLQALIEGGAARLFPPNGLQEDLTHRLIMATQEGLKTQPDGQVIAPNLFTLVVHPTKRQELSANADLLEALTLAIQEAGMKAGFQFLKPPIICVEEDSGVAPQDFLVTAKIYLEDITQTTDMDIHEVPGSSPIPADSFLIVDGTQVFPLSEPVINIGRRPDNQLVIEDSRVSRVHAQLRSIKGRYVIFDLDTKGGTFVNNQRVHQSTLYPGDVISLAGVPLIFGQDESELGETQQFFPNLDG